MTLEKAYKPTTMHASSVCDYNWSAARMLSGRVMRDFDQQTVGVLIREYKLEKLWERKPDTKFESTFKR